MTVPRELLRDAIRHMEWADARVWAAICKSPPADTRLLQLVKHVHVVQCAFLTIWRGDDINALFRNSEALVTLTAVREWARPYYAQAHAFLDAQPDAGLAATIEMPWAAQIADILGHPPAATTVAETMLQVTSHSTYHRGQVNARLRALEIAPPLVDYIAWLWSGRPAPEWPA